MKTIRKHVRSICCFVMGVMLLCGMGHNALACEAPDVVCSATWGNVTVSSRFAELFFGEDKQDTKQAVPSTKSPVRTLIPGGEVFGVKIASDTVTVSDVENASVGLCVGDCISAAGGKPIHSAADMTEAVRNCQGTLLLTVKREGKEMTLSVSPDLVNGEYRLGVLLHDTTAGIGTVTFFDPETGIFGGLGHGIYDTENNEILPMRQGIATEVTLGGVKKGESGKPGELHGVLRNRQIGVLDKNCPCGIFGRLPSSPSDKKAVPVATRVEVHEGEATILSTVTGGGVGTYAITIRDIDYHSDGTKSFTVKVTDPALIAMTGGIVRGMSGSPIIQDGKLVGAVTHVMVADPTEGYGIFIENMLTAAEVPMPMPKAA